MRPKAIESAGLLKECGNWVYGAVEPMPIRARELDEMEAEHAVIRRLAIEAASALYSERFDRELANHAFAPVFASAPSKKIEPSPHRTTTPTRMNSTTIAPPPLSPGDYLLSAPPLWFGGHTTTPLQTFQSGG